MSRLPTKSAHFVIHKLEELRRGGGQGTSVTVDGKAMDEIVFEGGYANIRSMPPPAAETPPEP